MLVDVDGDLVFIDPNIETMPALWEESNSTRFRRSDEELAADLRGASRRSIVINRKAQQDVIDGLASGRIIYPRFTPAEVGSSNGQQHERLWSYILPLESSKNNGERGGGLSPSGGASDERWGAKNGALSGLGTLVGTDPRSGSGLGVGKYIDKGVESFVFLSPDGTVNKVRKFYPSSANSVIEELAKIVYHNYLFPKDAYTLRDILRYEKDGYTNYFLDIEQPLVTNRPDSGTIINGKDMTGSRYATDRDKRQVRVERLPQKAERALRENGSGDYAEILRGNAGEPPQRYADFEAGKISQDGFKPTRLEAEAVFPFANRFVSLLPPAGA